MESKEREGVDLREFLSQPFEAPWSAALRELPNVELLRYLPTIKNEIGLVYRDGVWAILKGVYETLPNGPRGIGISFATVPKDATVLLHSHPTPLTREEYRKLGREKSPNAIDSSMPSPEDFYCSWPTAKNFIVSTKGITHYSLSMSQAQRDVVFIDPLESAFSVMKVIRRSIIKVKNEAYLYTHFLSQIGAKVQVYPWNEVTDERLDELFHGPTE